MKAIRFARYGDPTEVLSLQDVPDPTLAGDDEVLVRVAAAGLNPMDWHIVSGVPYLARLQMGLRPRTHGLGADAAGVVEQVGPGVTGLTVGDPVLGMVGGLAGTPGPRLGSVAELVVVRARHLVRVPDGVTMEEAAAVGVAGTTALRAIRDVAVVVAGERVLVHGASGGVGHLAVQIAVADGAEVIGVCSTAKTAMVHELGASEVLDYTRTDPRDLATPVDVVLDNVGDRSPASWRGVLNRDGRYVANFGRKSRRLVGPLTAIASLGLLSAASSHRFVMLPSRTERAELEEVAQLLSTGRLRPVVGHTVDLVDAPAAMQVVAGGHARGKVVVRVQGV